MTKKSLARQERDKLKAEMTKQQQDNKCWDDMASLYNSFAEALVTANSQLNEIYKVPNLVNFIPKKDEVIVALRGLSQDIRQFGTDLNTIHSRHKDRTGGFTDEEDMMASIQVFEEYTNYQVRYDAVIMPTVTFLLEQAELAFIRINEVATASQAEKEKADLVDPTVISDAIVK